MIQQTYIEKIIVHLPLPSVLLKPDAPHFTILYANTAYKKISNSTDADLLGLGIFETFPDNPADGNAYGVRTLSKSLNNVIATGQPQKMQALRYDIPIRGTNQFTVKYWQPNNIPLFNDDGTLFAILHMAEDVTEQTLLEQKHLKILADAKKLEVLTEVEDVQFGSWELTVDKNELYWSAELFDMLGYKADEVTLDFDFGLSVVHPEDRERAVSVYQQVMQTGGTYQIKKRVIKKNGDIIEVQAVGFAVTDATGNVFKLTGIFQNMTAANRIGALLRESVTSLSERNEFIERILKHLPIGISVNRISDGKATVINSRFYEIYGWDATDFDDIPSFFQKVYPDEAYRNKIVERIEADIASGVAARMQWEGVTITTKLGEQRVVNAKNIPLFDQNLMISTVIDVTKEARQAAEINKAKLNQEALINGAFDLIWSLDKGFNIINANSSFVQHMYQASGIEVKEGNNIFQYLSAYPLEVADKYTGYFETALSGTGFSVRDVSFMPTTGKTAYALLSFNPMYNEQNEVFGIACYLKDISSDVENQLEVRRSRDELLQIMDSSVDIITTVDANYQFVKINKACSQIIGYQPEELLGKNYLDFVVKEDTAATIAAAKSVIAGVDGNHFENRYLHKNGTIVPIIWSGRWDAKTQLMYCVGRDASEIKRVAMETQVMIDNTEEAFVMVGKQYEIQYANKQFYENYQKYFGYEVIKGASIFNYTLPENRGRLKTIYDTVFKGKIVTSDISLKTEFGNEKIFVMKYKPACNNSNEIIGAFVSIIDITEKQIALQIAKESNQRFDFMVKATFDAIWDWDIVNNTLYWGDVFYEVFGYNKADKRVLTIEFWEDAIHPNDFDKINDITLKLLEGTESLCETHYQLRKADGTYCHVIDRGYIIRDKRGKAVRMVGSVRDISARKAEETQLKLLESVITHGNDAVLITEAEPFDEPGPKILYVNEAFTRLSGYTAEEVIGKTPRMLQGPATDMAELRKLGAALRKWESYEITTINYKKNGQPYWINFTVNPVADESGWYTHWVAIERDVTERKNKELQQVLMDAIGQTLHKPSDSLNETLDNVLRLVAMFGSYCVAEAWVISKDAKRMNMLAHYANLPAMDTFYKETAHHKRFDKTQGIVGLAWKTRKVQVWPGTSEQLDCPRLDAVKKAGVEKIYAIPLMNASEEMGVLVLGLNQPDVFGCDLDFLVDTVCPTMGTEIKHKQLEVEVNEIFSFAPDIICIMSIDGYFKKINPAACELLEYSEAELLAQPFDQFIHPEDRYTARAHLTQLESMKHTHYYENRYLSKYGKTKWLAWTCTIAYEKEEGLLFAVAKDITEKKELENLLKKSNDLSRIGSWDVDLVTNTIYWSDMTKEIHEVESNFQLSFENPFIFYKDEKLKQLLPLLAEKAISKGESWDIEAQIITAKGNEKWVRIIGDAEVVNGNCIKVYGSFQDIDDKKKAELERELLLNELSFNNNELKQFSYITTHNLRAPLTNLISICNLLNLDNITDPLTLKLIDGFKKSTFHLNETLNDLISILIIKENRNLPTSEMGFQEMLDKVTTSINSIIQNSGARIKADFSEAPVVHFNNAYLESIFLNLLTNAIKYAHTERRPLITIKSTLDKAGKVHLVFADNGIGMNMERVRHKIFGLYQRFHNNADGKGIGLYLIHSQITALGGDIKVESEEQVGTTFTIDFN